MEIGWLKLEKLYNSPLKHVNKMENKQVFRRRYSLIIDDRGDFMFNHFDVVAKQQSNYLSYIKDVKESFKQILFQLHLKRRIK